MNQWVLLGRCFPVHFQPHFVKRPAGSQIYLHHTPPRIPSALTLSKKEVRALFSVIPSLASGGHCILGQVLKTCL